MASSIRARHALAMLALFPLTLAAACGDDGGGESSEDGGGEAEASQAVKDACAASQRVLDDAIVGAGCDSNYDLLVRGCERKGAEAEAAGCLAEFEADHACLVDMQAEISCTCDGATYGCSLPCLDEGFAVRECVGD